MKKLLGCYVRRMNTRRVKDEETSCRSKNKELRGKASTFPVYEENG